MRRAAAFEGHVDMREAEPRGGVAGERVGAALAVAAQIDQRAEPVAAHGGGEARGCRVVGAVELAGNHLGPIVPQHAEHGVIDQQAVRPGADAPARARQRAGEGHVRVRSAMRSGESEARLRVGRR